MKLLRVPDSLEIIPSRKSAKHNIQLATNKDILTSVIETCKQFHTNCETCPYWLENKFTCVFGWYGKDCLAYHDYEIEERIV